MHSLHIVTLCIVLSLIGAEFSVTAFVNPSAWRLDPEPQLKFLGQFAAVLGKVMPLWYAASLLLLAAETWLHRHTTGFNFLLAATAIWILVSAAAFLFLIPLNNRVAQGHPDWQRIHHTWDQRHRVRVGALAIAAALLTHVIAR